MKPNFNMTKWMTVCCLASSIFVCISSCITFSYQNREGIIKEIDLALDTWHDAAARADFTAYFDFIASDGIFIGTDATENWNKKAFEQFAKPYFDKGKAWSFHALERHIYLDPSGKLAWFDELLETQMKICRGSGVVTNKNGQWKLNHYVLSMTFPNDSIQAAIKLKTVLEDSLIHQLNMQK